MSDHAASDTPPPQPAEPFDNAEIREFDAADHAAGRTIGKMLSILFIYTIIAMSLVSWWTYNAGSH